MTRSSAQMQRLHADDLRVGSKFLLSRHHVTEGEAINFAEQWDPQYFHIDREAARQSYFGELIASGIHTIAVYARLASLDHFDYWNIVAGKSFRNLQFLRPVRPGDVLNGHFVIDDIVDRGDRPSLVTTTGVLDNQDGLTVLSLSSEFVVHSRQSARRQ